VLDEARARPALDRPERNRGSSDSAQPSSSGLRRNDAPCAAVYGFRSGTAPSPKPNLPCPPGSGKSFGNLDIIAGAAGY
jgi:hypothetical protein